MNQNLIFYKQKCNKWTYIYKYKIRNTNYYIKCNSAFLVTPWNLIINTFIKTLYLLVPIINNLYAIAILATLNSNNSKQNLFKDF